MPTMQMPNACRTMRILAAVALALLLATCNSNPATPDSAPAGDMKIKSADQAPRDTTLDVGAPDTVDAAAPDTVACPPMNAKLPTHAFANSSVAVKDQAFLDAMATEYACAQKAKGLPVDDAYFFYSHAPVTLFNRIIKGDTKDINKMRWVFHVSGHFGAVWLRNGLNKGATPPDGGLVGDAGAPPDAGPGGGKLGDMTAEAKRADTAANGPSSKLFQYNKDSLLAFIYPNLGIASNFGYNKGYLLEIYQKPPKTVKAPAGFVTCSGVLWCDYAKQRVPVLATLKQMSKAIEIKTGKYKDLVWAQTSQSVAEVLGHMVWGTFMKKEGMDQKFYDGLLDISASFLEVVQAAGLLSAKGYAEQNVKAGKAGALVQSGLAMWLGAYMGGFSGGGKGGKPLPEIVPATKK